MVLIRSYLDEQVAELSGPDSWEGRMNIELEQQRVSQHLEIHE